MKNFIQPNFLLLASTFFILSFSKICLAQEISQITVEEKTRLPKCSRNLTLGKLPESISYIDETIFTQGEGSETCSIGLKFSKRIKYDYNKFGLYVYTKDFELNDFLRHNGFEKNNKDKWKFKGQSNLLKPKNFTLLKTTEIKESEGFILLGQSTERGYISKGGPISLKAYKIIRKSPDFYVDSEIIINSNLSDSTANHLIKDLIETIRNIKINENNYLQ